MEKITITDHFWNYKDRDIYYKKIGTGKIPLIFIPGWMPFTDQIRFKDILSDKVFKQYLEKYSIYAINLSNFNRSDVSNKPLTLEDYSEEIKAFIEYLNVKKVNIMAHSAGSRFVINFISKYPEYIDKLIILNGAGINKTKASESAKAKASFKFAKFYSEGKEREILGKTFENIYNEYQFDQIKEIKVKTLIIWGEQDTTMKVKSAYKFSELIKDSRIEIFPHLDHMTILYSEVYLEIFKFLEE